MPSSAEPTAAPLRTESPVCPVGVDWGSTQVEGRVARTRPVFTPGDLRRVDSLRQSLAPTRAAFGDIGVLVNSFAIDRRHTLAEADEGFFDATVAVNAKPAFFAALRVVPDTQRGDEAAERKMDRNQCLPGRIVGGDVAQMAQLLAAEDSRMITAQEFVVDAGRT